MRKQNEQRDVKEQTDVKKRHLHTVVVAIVHFSKKQLQAEDGKHAPEENGHKNDVRKLFHCFEERTQDDLFGILEN